MPCKNTRIEQKIKYGIDINIQCNKTSFFINYLLCKIIYVQEHVVYLFLLFRPALTNDDFRKLLMTPRVGAPDVAPPSASVAKLKVYVL